MHEIYWNEPYRYACNNLLVRRIHSFRIHFVFFITFALLLQECMYLLWMYICLFRSCLCCTDTIRQEYEYLNACRKRRFVWMCGHVFFCVLMSMLAWLFCSKVKIIRMELKIHNFRYDKMENRQNCFEYFSNNFINT